MAARSTSFASRRRRLLQSVSVVAFATALGSHGVHAGGLSNLLSAAHLSGNGAAAPNIAVPVVPGLSTSNTAANAALSRQLSNIVKAQQAVNVALQAQTAAQQAAAAMQGGVPNGLVVGGLQPVANPLPAANDPTGLSTWQGANLPTQSVASGGAVTVNIQQTAPQAVLDWTTFNVGANTTLNFNQSQNGVAEPSWVVLNRVVGQLNPATGLRNPNLAPAPSQILGSVKAQGTVLVINQNGILFSSTAQINTNSLIATSLEIGASLQQTGATGLVTPVSLAQRNQNFLNNGLIFDQDTNGSGAALDQGLLAAQFVNGSDSHAAPMAETNIEGSVVVQTGAQITSGSGGFILLAAPQVTNSGSLTSPQGQVIMAAGRLVQLIPSDGSDTGDNNPNVRGLLTIVSNPGGFTGDSVENTATGLIQAPDGYVGLLATTTASNAGTITATTSTERNGFIQISANNVELAPGSTLAITPDDNGTIPQDPTSLADFKSSLIEIGPENLNLANPVAVADNAIAINPGSIDVGANSLIYAPSANVFIGGAPGSPAAGTATSQVFVDTGAVIDVSGLKNIQLAATEPLITISPVTANDTADDSPSLRALLDNTTVTLDTRLSGVRSDGVAWVGSPVLPEEAQAEQIGVDASELMTKGGNVVLGSGVPSANGQVSQAPGVVVKPGAVIDISGGWLAYQAGVIQTTELIDSTGAIVPIGDANPNNTYIGIFGDFISSEPRYGITQTFTNPLLTGAYFQSAYIQGADAGSLTIQSSQPTLQGTVYASAFPGPYQLQGGQAGTATSTLFGDQRTLQANPTQLPAGGLLFFQEATGIALAGGDVDIVGGPQSTSAANVSFGQAVAPADRATLTLSADTLSAMGLGELSFQTSGGLTVESGANLALAPGGVFSAVTGRAITIDGSITAPSGTINLQTVDASLAGQGSIFAASTAPVAGDFDVTVNGTLSTAGLWTNDFGAGFSAAQGPGYINGGSINILVAGRVDALGSTPNAGSGDVASVTGTDAGSEPDSTTDISGSILLDGPHTLLNVSAGGYVSPSGALTLTAKGGNVALTDPTAYFAFGNGAGVSGDTPGFRVNGIVNATTGGEGGNQGDDLAINPSAITSQVAIGPNALEAYGFSGGTFSLFTPSLTFGVGISASGTELPLDFFSKAGFGTYNITSYATDIVPNTFNNGFGGFNAVLAEQVLTVQAGQTLNLTQTNYSDHLTGDQIAALRALPSGSQMSSVLAPVIQPDGFDQQAVNLNLGGLIELEVAQGGTVTGAAGASLSAAQINNMGTIRLPGGTLSQSETLPEDYVTAAQNGTLVTASSLSQIFSVNADGTISESAPSLANPKLTNAQVAADDFIYLTGDLPSTVGIRLAPGSVTDLSGESLRNPFASGITDGRQVIAGTIVAGGTLQTAAPNPNTSSADLFPASPFDMNVALTKGNTTSLQPGLALVAASGSAINLSGASDTFDQLAANGTFVSTPQWSSGGNLVIGAGGVLAGATIQAAGGAPQAAGGALTLATGSSSTPVLLAATDPTTPTLNTYSAQQIQAAGFGTMVVQGTLGTSGSAPVNLTLGQAFFLEGVPLGTITQSPGQTQAVNPVVGVTGTLQVNAPYISLDGGFQGLTGPNDGASAGAGSVVFNAQALDVTGAVLFDAAVANVTLESAGDLRFIGVAPFAPAGQTAATPSLAGQLAVNGNLNLVAGQVYATTGSTYAVTSTANTGTITIAAVGPTPATPYSAGSNLTIQAANIVQDGVVRAPIGSLTLGGNTPLSLATQSGTANGGGASATYAPATATLTLGPNSVTSVSADGLSIPYGTTTDQTEFFFTPTNANPLTAPPAAILTLNGKSVATQAGATVDLSGGGDVYAYEFVPGTGGSHDVLSQFNTDTFTSNNGFQFPDQRQVYAIVPSLQNAPVAAFDPIYSSNYASLYGPSMVGQRVYLQGGPGVAAGWYTLLPAQYATLPGGMEVIENTSANASIGSSAVLGDGTVAVTGQFGGLGGAVQSALHTFDVKSQSVIFSNSDIALTSADTFFAQQAADNAQNAPRLPIDSGQLIINPGASLSLAGTFDTTPGTGGRSSEVDISASSIDITDQAGAPTPGVLQLAANQLDNLNAGSLLIGGTRTDNADGSTTLDVTAHQITVANDAADPLTGPDIVLAVDGAGSSLTVRSGAVITASGTDTTGQTGDYIISGGATGETGQGALVRVSNGPARLVTRETPTSASTDGLDVGAATLSGASVLLDSSGTFNLSSSAAITAGDLALDASSIAFAPSAQGLSGLVITPTLLASFAQAQTLTLRSPNVIDFTAGSYGFGGVVFDTPGLAVAGGTGTVSVNASGAAQLQNSFADVGGCTTGGALACGGGLFNLAANTLTFGDGTFRIFGAGQGATLSAPGGVFVQGEGALNVDAAPLTIQTSYLGDQLGKTVIGTPNELPSLAIATTGALVVDNPTGAATPTVTGVPGSTLTLSGQSIAVSGVDVRATAGSLTLTSATGIAVGAGATLETPGYAASFGDSADPFSENAPAGLLTLTASNGNINLAADSVLSVGGGAGAAGSLVLNAGQGSVSFGGTVTGAAPTGGANFTLNEAGAFDLSSFETATSEAFNGNVSVETGSGGLTLASGLTLTAANVTLSADAGLVDIAGTINVNGVNGGDVGLFGAGGVTLESGSLISARASGYGPTDSRQASGGQVELGVSGTGAITVAQGATIDVSADDTNPRLVSMIDNGVTNYSYVAPDVGGQVLFRAPVSGGDGNETVNVSVAGAVTGASSIVLQGYKAWDLQAVAASGQYSGVTVSSGTATLNTADTLAAGSALPNFLADNAPGTLVDFIQNFSVSGSYANLGGLASLPTFHAQPGVELDYSGNITLASNWNLGAGTVNVAGAVAAGLMVADPNVPGSFAILPGDEAAVFSNYTNLTYRVGGSVLGAPGALSLKAGGQLTLNGSVTDGFFTFGDQTNQTFLNTGGQTTVFDAGLTATCVNCASVPNFNPSASSSASSASVSINFAAALQRTPDAADVGLVPYEAAANTPAALGNDPIASAEMFPLVQTASGLQTVSSWSYQLTGGAKLGSANPLGVATGASGGVTVQGAQTYSYGATTTTGSFSNALNVDVNNQPVSASQFVAAEEAANPSLNPNSLTKLTFTGKPAMEAAAATFFSQFPGQFTPTGPTTAPTAVTTSLALAGQFLQFVAANWSTLKTGFTAPTVTIPTKATVTVAPLIRTGTGSISIAAAGDINLQNGANPTFINPTTGQTSTTQTPGSFQEGGIAVYTAGALVDPTTVTADGLTLNPSAFATVTDNIGEVPYGYGVVSPSGLPAGTANGTDKGVAGVLVGNAVYAEGGGDISLSAGGNVLGRRDDYTPNLIQSTEGNAGTAVANLNFIGTWNQPWRIGLVGMDTNILVNPALFTSGVGTLGGGNIRVSAGGDVSDLTVAADTTVTTAQVSGGAASAQQSQALLTYGGGNVAITAGGNLLGGRVDVASGAAQISVGGDVAPLGQAQTFSETPGNLSSTPIANSLLLRLTDATIDLTAHGGVEIQGISALGVQQPASSQSDVQPATSNADALGFYSANAGVSITTDGTVTFDNKGADVLFNRAVTTDNTPTAILPGSLQAVSIEGNLSLAGGATESLLYPSPAGTLTLAAGADIGPVNMAMLDNDPGLTPGVFSQYQTDAEATLLPGSLGITGIPFAFPAVLPGMSQAQLEQLHDSLILHKDDPVPNRIYAGGDIDNVILSVPKQTRIGAGEDIVNMVFFGQNLNPTDVTRIVAGRDITATTTLESAIAVTLDSGGNVTSSEPSGPLLPTLQGNTFVIGGPGSFWLEAGRNLGPFLPSVTTTEALQTGGLTTETFGGGVLSVGNSWNPWLPSQGASLYVEFGVAKGQDFDALLNYYLNPTNFSSLPDYLFVETLNADNVFVPDHSQPLYAPQLIAWMQANDAQGLVSAFGTTNVSYDQAYQVFAALPQLQQRPFLLQVYFSELSLTSVPGPTLNNYTRGYMAVNLLFPSSLGYTANNLTGGTNGANALVHTGDLDLRLAAIETEWGGDIDILGPGGQVLAGSTVATAQQAARRNADDLPLFNGGNDETEENGVPNGIVTAVSSISSIPAGFEGVLTLRGGSISTFTDTNFTLNQSRLFTEEGGDIIMWSSNGNLDAGEGPKTSSDFPPVQVLIDNDAFSELDQSSAVTGAGIAAFPPEPGNPAPDVFLVAPRGTVDAGAAGVRFSGDLFVAALHVANADNFTNIGNGVAVGLPPTASVPNVSATASSAAAAVTRMAQQVVNANAGPPDDRSIITVEVLGFGDQQACPDPLTCAPRRK